MLLTLENVGRFYENTEMEINGISIVAGKNGTGKSTLGKALYCTVSSLYDIKRKIEMSRITSIRRKLFTFSMPLKSEYHFSMLDAKKIYELIRDDSTLENISDAIKLLGFPIEQIDEQDKHTLLADLQRIVVTADDDIALHIVENRLEERFGGQLHHVNYTDESSKIILQIRDSRIEIEENNQADFTLKEYLPLMKDIIYIDDEYSLEKSIAFNDNYTLYNSDMHLDRNVLKKKNDDVVGEILAEERYKRIIERMNEANIGDLVKGKGRNFEYKENGLKGNIKFENISSGTKIMVLIKQIILNGYLEDNGIMVLDEPEIHLHPEWQKILAEIIVIMQFEFNINFLINTHSSDFVAFIQFYVQKYNIAEKYRAYLIKDGKENSTSILCDVTKKMDEIYKMLGEPFINVSEELEYKC